MYPTLLPSTILGRKFVSGALKFALQRREHHKTATFLLTRSRSSSGRTRHSHRQAREGGHDKSVRNRSVDQGQGCFSARRRDKRGRTKRNVWRTAKPTESRRNKITFIIRTGGSHLGSGPLNAREWP